MKKPLIGITPDYEKQKEAKTPRNRIVIHEEYGHAIERAGGLQVILPLVKSKAEAKELFEKLDGILFTGGDDMQPENYNQTAHTKTKLMHINREKSDFIMMETALEMDIPSMCICAGIQLFNVALGGTLIQDIPDQIKSNLDHMMIGKEVAHDVVITPDTILHKILGKTKISTNSMHHQAIKEIGKGLVISAKATDGIIEGVELQDKKFFIGVQWHPEEIPNSENHNALFSYLIEAAKK